MIICAIEILNIIIIIVELPEWTLDGFCPVIGQSEDGEKVWKIKPYGLFFVVVGVGYDVWKLFINIVVNFIQLGVAPCEGWSLSVFFPGPVWVVGKFSLNVNRGCNNKGNAWSAKGRSLTVF